MHLDQPPDKGIGDAEHGPHDQRERQAHFGADLVNDPAGQNRHAGVESGEECGQMRKVRVGPAKPAQFNRSAEIFLEIADDLPVHVVDRGGEKQQGADDPAKIA